MRFDLSLVACGLLASTAMASDMAKVVKRAAAPTDVEILNFALTLEYLERDFYAQGLAKFSKSAFKKAGFSGTDYERIKQIGAQEADHVSFLSTALGSAAVGECKYNFPLTDVATFLTVAKVLEGVGVTAYLGAAPDITTKAYLAAAGSILTVEARHSSFLNEALGTSGFPTPYDAALTYSQVYTLAAPFIVPGSCGTSGTLPPGLHAYPKLTVKTAAPKAGRAIGFHFPLMAGYTGPYYAAFVQSNQVLYAQINMKNGVARVPPGLSSGIVYIIITKTASTPSDSNTLAGPAYSFIQ